MFDFGLTEQLKAESYLGILFPDMDNDWIVHNKGLFFRNYSRDIIKLHEDKPVVSLSRDGWLKYFPQELISPEDELVGDGSATSRKKIDIATKDKKIRRRIALLQESFVPFDTYSFRQSLKLEKKIQEILSIKVNYILKEFFNFDIEAEKDEYVKKAALLLPYIGKIRGNVRFIQSLLQSLTKHKVKMRFSTYGHTDHTKCAIRKVFYDIIIDNLTSAAYEEETEKIRPLVDFIQERFVPINLLCVVNIKGTNPDEALLDYNYVI